MFIELHRSRDDQGRTSTEELNKARDQPGGAAWGMIARNRFQRRRGWSQSSDWHHPRLIGATRRFRCFVKVVQARRYPASFKLRLFQRSNQRVCGVVVYKAFGLLPVVETLKDRSER